MAIERGKGNLLTADVEALVNTVNTVGVMGKGLALQFKAAFQDNFIAYEKACKKREVAVGRMFVFERDSQPKYIINFPTKKHWRNPSRIQYLNDGLIDLVSVVQRLNIQSIAIPPLGCGNGGLHWPEVKPLIVEAFKKLPAVHVILFEPEGAPDPEKMINRTKRPAMSPGRAAVLALMNQYLATGYEYRLSLLEVQKLAYFLQAAGEDLRLHHEPSYYGPYADELRKVLRHMEGHFTVGVGDGANSPETPLQLLEGSVETALEFLKTQPDTMKRLRRVAGVIEGFETPFGMELLATVHWVMSHGSSSNNVDEVIAGVHAWSSRKRSTMKAGQIRAAWEHLRNHALDASL